MTVVDDLPSKSEIFDYWKDRLSELGFFIDFGEPSCWACKHHYSTKYDVRRGNSNWSEVLKSWDRVPLQRCHIVPRSLGGSQEPSNLFLMCRECHDLAPNTTIREIFFDWARFQSAWRREIEKLVSAFEAFGIPRENISNYKATISSTDFEAWVQKKFGIHRPQSNYAAISARLTPSTIVGLILHYEKVLRNEPLETNDDT